MSEKSLKIHPDWIQEVKAAYRSRYSNQNELAEKADISSVDTISKFLNGKPVKRANFWKLCDLLEISREQVIKEMRNGTSSLDKSVNMVTIAEVSDRLDVLQSEVLEAGLENPNFIGRDKEVGYIHHLTVQGAKCILIVGTGGMGKTTLARNYLEQSFNSYIEFSIAKERSNIASIASLVEEKLRSLGEETGKEFMVSLERLKCRLQRDRIGVLIDNLEPALDGNGQFVDEHRGYIELLRVLTDSSLRSTTLITSREPLNEALDIQTLILGGLKDNVWHSFFSQQGINVDISILTEVHRAFGGNALAMKILCTPIKTYHDGDLASYWQECKTETGLVVEQALENLVREQFDRLQNNCLEAYKLLCRIGCFRYQDVPTVPKEGLFSLLWDVTQGHHIRIINSLRDRSLIEFDKGEYFLHPIIRAEAIYRLRGSEEWEDANFRAAKFWTSSVISVSTIKDALTAFEGYHHCLEIADYNSSAQIINYARENKWTSKITQNYSGERLGYSFLRLGLLEKSITSIEKILDKVTDLEMLVYLHNNFGDILWLSGSPNQAIVIHQRTCDILNNIKSFDKKSHSQPDVYRYYLSSLLNVGLCNLSLNNIDIAESYFEKLLESSTNNLFEIPIIYLDTYVANAEFCLALTKSLNLDLKNTLFFIERLKIRGFYNSRGSWSKGWYLLFIGHAYKNIKYFDDAFKFYYMAIDYAMESGFYNVEGISLCGVGECNRLIRDYQESLENLYKSIKRLKKIGVRCDLAEAYFQLGLTYQAMGDHDQSEEYKAKALELFAQMEAPKQIERVNKAFGGNIQ